MTRFLCLDEEEETLPLTYVRTYLGLLLLLLRVLRYRGTTIDEMRGIFERTRLLCTFFLVTVFSSRSRETYHEEFKWKGIGGGWRGRGKAGSQGEEGGIMREREKRERIFNERASLFPFIHLLI